VWVCVCYIIDVIHFLLQLFNADVKEKLARTT